MAQPQPQMQSIQRAPEKKKLSTLSLLAFIFSIIGCTAPIGGILAIIDLIKNKDDGKKHWGSIVALVIFGLFILYAATSSGSTKETKETTTSRTETVVDEEKPEEKQAEAPKEEPKEEEHNNRFNVGDVVETDDLKITYVSNGEYDFNNQFITPKDGYEYMYFEFIFENISDSDEHISSMLNWECYADNMKVDQTWDMDNNGLDATLSTGRQTQGIVIFEVPKDAQTIELEYDVNFWLSDKIVFIGK